MIRAILASVHPERDLKTRVSVTKEINGNDSTLGFEGKFRVATDKMRGHMGSGNKRREIWPVT